MKIFRLSLAAVLCSLAVPAIANAGSTGANTTETITIAANTNVDRYPSTLKVQSGDGPITSVQPFITVSHTFPDDLDIALVSPAGQASVLMSDACGGDDLVSRTFVFSATAAAPLSDDGTPVLCTSGSYQPTNYVAETDTWAAPGPGTLTTTNLGVFNGRNPNGDWKLFVRDRQSPDGGTITQWGLTITTTTSTFVIPAGPATSGVANTYPSVKTFDTPDGQVIDDANLRVSDVNHQHPADIDMLLQAPTGETVMAMSDACGSTDINTNFNWTFDDESAFQFGDNVFTNCTQTTVRPVDFGDPAEDMPAPAPARPYGATMTSLDGLQGGAFRLFINDDSGGDTGYMSDWDLTLTARPASATGFTATNVATAEGQTAQLTVTREAKPNLGPATLGVAVTDGDTNPDDFATSPPTSLTFARGETQKTIEIPVASDLDGEPAETFNVALVSATNDALLTDATSFATVTIAKSEPDNSFQLGNVTRKRNGSATIAVTIPSPGLVSTDDAGSKDLLKETELFAETAGTVSVKIKPASKTKRKLRKGKKVKLTTAVTYTPNDGSPNSKDAQVKLKRKP